MNRAFIVRLAFLGFLSCDSRALAEEAPTRPIQVDVGNGNAGSWRLPREAGAIVHRRAEEGPKSSLPEPEKRNRLYSRVKGLEASLAGMDELDRDLLYVRAESLNAAELAAKYPQIPANQLADLQANLREAR